MRRRRDPLLSLPVCTDKLPGEDIIWRDDFLHDFAHYPSVCGRADHPATTGHTAYCWTRIPWGGRIGAVLFIADGAPAPTTREEALAMVVRGTREELLAYLAGVGWPDEGEVRGPRTHIAETMARADA
jgi:hypothetical protein